MRAPLALMVLEHTLRQQPDESEQADQSEEEETSSLDTYIWVIIVVVLGVALIGFLVFITRLFVSRRRTHARPRVRERSNPSENDYLMYAYLQTQPPSVTRMHRLANADGLSAQELNDAAPLKAFAKVSASSEDNVCAVCLEEMEPDAKTRKLPCGHEFDARCIEEWVSKANRCPVCNTHVVEEEALKKRRLAAIQGRDVSPSGGRQRRRRIRGENGTYEIRSGRRSAASETSPEDSRHALQNRGDTAGSSDQRQARRASQPGRRRTQAAVERAREGGHELRAPRQTQRARTLQPAET